MKRNLRLYRALLFLVAALAFLLSELYFFLNPMFDEFDFIGLYLGPLLLFLLSLAATVGLYRLGQGHANGLLLALALLVDAVMIGVHVWFYIDDSTLQVLYYPANQSLWFSLSLWIASALTTALACRQHAKSRPGRCAALLFTLALCCALLGGVAFFNIPVFGSVYLGWFLGPLLLFLLSLATTVGLYRLEQGHTNGLLLALACIAIVAAIFANLWACIWHSGAYPRGLAVLFSAPLFGYGALCGILARKKMQHGRCCKPCIK